MEKEAKSKKKKKLVMSSAHQIEDPLEFYNYLLDL